QILALLLAGLGNGIGRVRVWRRRAAVVEGGDWIGNPGGDGATPDYGQRNAANRSKWNTPEGAAVTALANHRPHFKDHDSDYHEREHPFESHSRGIFGFDDREHDEPAEHHEIGRA